MTSNLLTLPSNIVSLNTRPVPDLDLNTTLEQLSEDPGVYRMLNAHGTVLYVGKAVNLKKRVKQYFQKTLNHPKTLALMRHIHAIEITITRTETEALLLESHFIKTHQPKYNILLRDDKTYPYILVDTTHPFPSISIYRSKHKPKKGKAFGPFPNTTAVHETLNALQKCFKIRNCRDSTFSSRTRPCLQYQIKRCSAPCTAFIDQKAYAHSVKLALDFLSGKSNILLKQLTLEMENASQRLAYEEAALIRDQIQQLHLIQQSQSIMHGHDDLDIIAIHATSTLACIEHVKIRGGTIAGNQAYFPHLPTDSSMDTPQEQWLAIFEAFVRFYYLENPQNIPPALLTQDELPTCRIQSYEEALKQLSHHPCRIQTHPRKAAKGWMDFTLNNLALQVKQKNSLATHLNAQIRSLSQLLKCTRPITRLECFDISHTQGQATMASCVVFDAHGPDKSAYRQFSIIGITPGDDYAALREAITRHYKKRIQLNQPMPQVLLIDGGKGQVNVAADILEKLNLNTITLLGITKGDRRKACYDRIYDASTKQYLILKADDQNLHFLQYLRDEAHRFAISAHRKKRRTLLLSSSLETIEGIGAKRRKTLIQYFGGLQGLGKASMQELLQVPGISPVLAARIVEHFKNK